MGNLPLVNQLLLTEGNSGVPRLSKAELGGGSKVGIGVEIERAFRVSASVFFLRICRFSFLHSYFAALISTFRIRFLRLPLF